MFPRVAAAPAPGPSPAAASLLVSSAPHTTLPPHAPPLGAPASAQYHSKGQALVLAPHELRFTIVCVHLRHAHARVLCHARMRAHVMPCAYARAQGMHRCSPAQNTGEEHDMDRPQYSATIVGRGCAN